MVRYMFIKSSLLFKKKKKTIAAIQLRAHGRLGAGKMERSTGIPHRYWNGGQRGEGESHQG